MKRRFPQALVILMVAQLAFALPLAGAVRRACLDGKACAPPVVVEACCAAASPTAAPAGSSTLTQCTLVAGLSFNLVKVAAESYFQAFLPASPDAAPAARLPIAYAAPAETVCNSFNFSPSTGSPRAPPLSA